LSSDTELSAYPKKFPVFDFLKFPLSNRKKIRASRDFYFSTGSGNVVESSKKSLGQSRPSCPREPNVVVWGVTSAGFFSAWHPTFVFAQWWASEAATVRVGKR
jgi:hypothetical protein